MSRVIPIVALIAVLAAGCRTMSNAPAAPSPSPGSPGVLTTASVPEAADGSSRERAVVIKAPSETAGIAQEGQWLQEHFPRFVKRGQSLIVSEGRSYDLVKIEVDGGTREIWFDITGFFGKW